MAVVNYNLLDVDGGQNNLRIAWTGNAGDTGQPYFLRGQKALAAASQVIGGTAGSVTIEQSIDGSNWAPVEINTVAVTMTSLNQVFNFSIAAFWIRPVFGTGASAAVVALALRG